MKKLRGLHHDSFTRSLLGGLLLLCWLAVVVFPGKAFSKNDPVVDFDELLVYVQLAQFGGMEIPAAIREERVFLSAIDLFDFLHIQNLASESIIKGFILHPEDVFVFDPGQGTLVYQGQRHELGADDMIQEAGSFYLSSEIFGKVFGLDCSFSFRNLSVTLTTELDLPVFRLKRQEMMRKNLHRLQEKVIADTVFRRKSSMARLSTADWNVTGTQELNPARGESKSLQSYNQSRVSLSLGGELAHGEAMAQLTLQEGIPLQSRNQFYQWRYVNNDFALAKQFTLGRINSQSTSTLFAPIVGMQVTNASTVRRKSFGSYRISDHTEPDWLVELYVNNLLVGYVKADATGFFTFDVPLIYGNTAIQLKYYGPHGEEQIVDKYINVPFNFLPKNELEYDLGGGLVEDGEGSVFSRGSVNYGLTNFLTVGGGVEYLSSLSNQPFMPFVQSSVRVSQGLMFTGDYMPGVRTRALVNYRLPESLQLELGYTKLEKGQKAIYHDHLEERRVALSMPFKNKNFYLFSRFSLSQKIYQTTQFTTGQLLLSSVLFGVNTSLSTWGNFHGNHSSYLLTELSQTYRLPAGFSFTPELQYNYHEGKISQVRARMEKRISKRGYLTANYQNNLQYKNTSFGIGLRFDLSFGHAGINMRQSNSQTFLTETAGGSLLYDAASRHLEASNRGSVGRGAITVLPFLDLNSNGKRDKDENLVAGLKFKVRGGQVQYDKQGEAIRINSLIAYEDYILELDEHSFDRITWKIKNPVIKVSVLANQFRQVEVPIMVMGEVAGTVYQENESNGMGRISINFYNEKNNLVHSAVSERDGYFSYMGLAPGEYTVMPDSAQLEQLGYTYKATKRSITIAPNAEGDYVDDLEFILHKRGGEPADADTLHSDTPLNPQEVTTEEKMVQEPDQVREPAPVEDKSSQPRKFTLGQTNQALLEILKNKTLGEQRRIMENRRLGVGDAPDPMDAERIKQIQHPDTYFRIQILASEKMLDLENPVFRDVEGIDYYLHKELYKYTYGIALDYDEAVVLLDQVRKMGFEDAFIVSFYKRRRLE
jgi:uncharacterized protein YdhG (YjbR/CyaY superfamily)